MASKVTIGDAKFSRRVSASKQARPFVVLVDAADFAGEIAKWPDMTEARLEDVLNDVTARAYQSVKERTPQLTGRARSQWFITLPSRFVRFIGNNIPYIRRLEHGWSRRPNAGFMVRATEKRFNLLVKAAAEKFWRFDVRAAERRAQVR